MAIADDRGCTLLYRSTGNIPFDLVAAGWTREGKRGWDGGRGGGGEAERRVDGGS